MIRTPPEQPRTPPWPYQLTTDDIPDRRGMASRLGQARPWLQGRKALDKLQTVRETNTAHIDAVAASDPEVAATLIAPLDLALSPRRENG